MHGHAACRRFVDRHWPAREPARQALEICREAGDIRERELGADDPLTIASRGLQTRLEEMVGSEAQAERSFAELGAALDPKLFNPANYERAAAEVRALWKSGRREDAMQVIRAHVAPLREKLGSDKLLIDGLMWFAVRQSDARDYAVSEALYRTAIERCRAIHRGDHPDTALAMSRLAHLLTRVGADDAEQACRDALAMLERLYDKPHAETGWVLHDLGEVLAARGDRNAAAAAFRRAIDARSAALGPNHELVAYTTERLARVSELASASPHEVVALRREAWRIRCKAHGEDDPRTAVAERHLAAALARLPQQRDEAERHFRHALDVLHSADGDQPVRRAQTCDELAWFVFEHRGDCEEAAALAREALQFREQAHGDDHRMVWRARRRLAYLLSAKSGGSAESVREAAELAESTVRHVNDEYAWQTAALVRLRAGEWQAAADAVRRSDALANGRSTINRLILALALLHSGDVDASQIEFDAVLAQLGSRTPGRVSSVLIDEFRTLAVRLRPRRAGDDEQQRSVEAGNVRCGP